MKKLKIISMLLIFAIPAFTNGILETFEVDNQNPFNGTAILNWIGDVGEFEITTAGWPYGLTPDFLGENSLRANSETEINATILTEISSIYDHGIKTRWEVFVSGGSTEITLSKGFCLILFVSSNNINNIESGEVNGYRLRLADPSGIDYPDGLYFEKASGSGWVMIDSVHTGDAKINQGWSLAVERDSEGNWSWGYSNGAYNSSVVLTESVSDNDFIEGNLSGMNWYSIASDANSFGFDNFKVDPYTPGMWREDAASSNWNSDSNWEDGVVPDGSSNVQIAPGSFQPEINANYSCNNLNILPGAGLTINSGKTITVNGDLLIESGSGGDGHLIDHGNLDVNGSFGIQRYLAHYGSGDNEFHFLSIPLANHAVENSLNNCYVYPYDESSNSWTSLSVGDQLIKGKGYSVYYSGNEDYTAIFNGTPNKGDQSIQVSASNYSGNTANDNWNLVGNPFPSPIDWDEVSKTNIEAAIYIWRPSSLSYASYVGGVGTNMNDDGIIPSMQAFFVHATSNGSFVVPQSARTLSHGQDYLKNTINEVPTIKIIASRNGFSDETVIRSTPGAGKSFDVQHDAYKFLSDHEQIVQICSLDDEMQKLSINSISQIIANEEIPLELFMHDADSIQLTFTGVETFGTDLRLALEDRMTDRMMELSKDSCFKFYITPGEEKRFVLHFMPQFNKIVNLLPDDAKIWVSAETINVTLKKIQNQKITIRLYDLKGSLLSSAIVQNQQHIQIKKPDKKGIYLLQLKIQNITINKKIYVEHE